MPVKARYHTTRRSQKPRGGPSNKGMFYGSMVIVPARQLHRRSEGPLDSMITCRNQLELDISSAKGFLYNNGICSYK